MALNAFRRIDILTLVGIQNRKSEKRISGNFYEKERRIIRETNVRESIHVQIGAIANLSAKW